MSRGADLDLFRTRDPRRFRIATEVRFADLDPNNHVNHARYLGYMEECRLAFRRALDAALALPPDLSWPVAEVTVRYLRSAGYPQAIAVELAPVHVGRTSFSLGYGLFDDDGCLAVGMSRSVCVSKNAGRPVPLPASLAARLRELWPAD